MAMPAPSIAFAVNLYARATRSSQMTRSALPVRRPIAARTGGFTQPCSTEYLRNAMAAMTTAIPATQEKSLTPMRPSQSKGFFGAFAMGAFGAAGVKTGRGGGGGGAGCGGRSGATTTGSGIGSGFGGGGAGATTGDGATTGSGCG